MKLLRDFPFFRFSAVVLAFSLILPNSGSAHSGTEYPPDTGELTPVIYPYPELSPAEVRPISETLKDFPESLESFLKGPNALSAVTIDTTPFQEASGLLAIEAEHPAENIARNAKIWEFLDAVPGFSGDGYLKATPDNGKSYDSNLNVNSPELKYNVVFDTPGTYYFWARALVPDTKGDSFHVGLEAPGGTIQTVRSYIPTVGSFVWSKAGMDAGRATFQVNTPGTYTVHLWMREDGFAFDKFLFTQDAAFVPQTLGPDESGRWQASAVTAPTVQPVSPFTNQSLLTLSGTKPAGTSIWINGAQAAALDASTSWTYNTTLTAEQLYLFSVTARNASNEESSAANVSITYDITPPAIVFTSPAVSSIADYLLGYTVDGAAKTKNFTLSPGPNVLSVTEKDAANNETTADYTVTFETSQPFEETGGVLVLETEHPHSLTAGTRAWSLGNSIAGFSGEGYFQASPDSGASYDGAKTVSSPVLNYQFFINTPGTFYAWVRGYAAGSGADSVHLALDGVLSSTADRISIKTGSFRWTKTTMDSARPTLNLTSGPHTLGIVMREDGFIVDKILLTQDPNFTPQNFGPDESSRWNPPAVAAPTVQPIPAATNQSSLTLSGTKPADTSIWIDGVQAAAGDGLTSWTANLILSQEQLYSFQITARNASNQESNPVTASITYDITPPAISFTSSAISATPDYTLTYLADGVPKSENFTLVSGPNNLSVTEQDAAGNQTTAGFNVTYDPSWVDPATLPFEEISGFLVIETEHAHSNTPGTRTWTEGNSLAGFTGTGYFQASPDTGAGYEGSKTVNSPVLKYNAQVTNTGIYYVWIRGYAPSTSSDSVHVSLDGVIQGTSDRISVPAAGAFAWSNSTMDGVRASVNIGSAGLHTLGIVMREDGLIVDRILLTQDPNYHPNTNGSTLPESARYSGEEPPPPDTEAPTGSISINSGSNYAAAPGVTLTLTGNDTGSGISEMRFSTDGGTVWTGWEAFAVTRNLDLPSGDGSKEVRMELRDAAGNVSQFSDTILLDTTFPASHSTVTEYPYAVSPLIHLQAAATDAGSGIESIRFTLNGGTNWTDWETYSGNALEREFTLSGGDGEKLVQIQIRDRAGLISTDSIPVILDTQAPTGSIVINAAAAYSNSLSLNLQLSGADATSGLNGMRFSSDGGSSWSEWETFTAHKPFTLPNGQGNRTVTLQLRDKAGLTGTFSDSIFVDTVFPAGSITVSGPTTTSASSVTVNLTAADTGGSGVDQVRYSNDGGLNWSAWENFSASKTLNLTPGDGQKDLFYQVRDRAQNISQFITFVTRQTPQTPSGNTPQFLNSGIFYLPVDDVILQQTAASGLTGMSFALTKKFFGTFADNYDFLVFMPSLNAGRHLSLQATNQANNNATGSYYFQGFNDITGLGQGTYDFRSSFGSSAAGEFEGMVMLDMAVNASNPSDRFGSSDLTNAANQTFFANVLTQELAHRFGSFLTSGSGNPLRILGRDLAHWGVFYDAEFSPMDGNNWTDNGNGTFTLTQSYYDEIAFVRSNPMPYNDLDLYSMGLLDAGQVSPSFVIENPTYQGKRLRPHNNDPSLPTTEGGPFVDIETTPGNWNGPYYLGNGVVIGGTRKEIPFSEISVREGFRNPAAAAAPKDFKVAFVGVTDKNEDSTLVSQLMTKVADFQTYFKDFFKARTRNLGTVSFPVPGAAAGTVSLGGTVAPLYRNAFLHHDEEEDEEEVKSPKKLKSGKKLRKAKKGLSLFT